MSLKAISIDYPDKNNIVNVLGIHPLFIDNGVCNDISLFNLYRVPSWGKKWKCENRNIFYNAVHYENRMANILYEMSTPAARLEEKVINLLLKNSRKFKSDAVLKDVEENSNYAKNVYLFYSELLRYWNKINRGNFFITSNKKLYDNCTFCILWLKKYSRYLVSEKFLPKNTMIIGARGWTIFDNPIIACPFFDREEYKNFLYNNNLTDYSTIDMSVKFPIMSSRVKLYENYEKYLNEKVPDKWHFEIFKNPEMHYITVQF